MQTRDVALSFFVGVGLAVVLIEREVSVRSDICPKLHYLLRLVRVLDRLAEGKNGTGTDKERQPLDWRVHPDCLSAANTLVRPIVVPISTCGKVNHTARRSLLGYRGHQECRTEHILVAKIGDFGIVGKVHEQGAHEGRASLVGLIAERIDVRHELIA